jgi:hypothetical protein
MIPIIFLLDLDGTLQGNIYPQVSEYSLIGKLNAISNKNIKYSINNLMNDFKSNLLRPYVKESLTHMKKYHPQIEFFVYTASSDDWAKFLIPKIDKYITNGKGNIFNKPYFMRSDVSEGIKSIKHVFPRIKRSLSKKYDEISINNVYLVDNNYVIHPLEVSKLIKCPSYDYTHIINPFRNLSNDIIEKYHNKISNELLQSNSKHVIEMYKKYYDRAFKEYEKANRENKEFINDDYWKMFGQLVINSDLKTQDNINKTINTLQKLHKGNKYWKLLEKAIIKI